VPLPCAARIRCWICHDIAEAYNKEICHISSIKMNKQEPMNLFMKTSKIVLLVLSCSVFVGANPRVHFKFKLSCDERVSYFGPRVNESDPGFAYRGELSEFDVLGMRAARWLRAGHSHALDSAKAVA